MKLSEKQKLFIGMAILTICFLSGVALLINLLINL